MDSFSVTAGVVALLTSILHGSKRMSDFITGFAVLPKTSKPFSADLKAFYEVLGVLTSMQDELSRNNGLCDWLRTPFDNCLDVFEEFTDTLHTHTEVSEMLQGR
jgi:Fungal N-terminal domain of STAND proteins